MSKPKRNPKKRATKKVAKRNPEKRVTFREGDRVHAVTGDAYSAKGVGLVGTVAYTHGPYVYVTVPKHGTVAWFRGGLKKLPKDLQPKKRVAKKTAKKNPVKRKITAKERVGEFVVKARTNNATLFYTRDGKFVANDTRAMRFFTQALAKAEAQKILPRLPASIKWLTIGNVR